MKNRLKHLIDHISNFKTRWPHLSIWLLLLSMLPINSYAEDDHVFLITGSRSNISSISKHDLRRIYLGGTAINIPEPTNPIINKIDISTYRLFLKNIMHMTENGYKRKVVKRVFRQGSDKIIEIKNLNELDNHFKEHPNDICFISSKHSSQMLNIKIIKTLW
ncbi:MAG: hypothetical protein OEY61_00680 [Gammaproteobacteria bacterium]|nr:hypothetical protein [Gammaproteobacteria bacterium]